ncbi:GSCOCG00010095001-RA-CDS [Cotesia congregata]|nr:GSCOCG00010095001-RA-CDS [Cotesia congregata]
MNIDLHDELVERISKMRRDHRLSLQSLGFNIVINISLGYVIVDSSHAVVIPNKSSHLCRCPAYAVGGCQFSTVRHQEMAQFSIAAQCCEMQGRVGVLVLTGIDICSLEGITKHVGEDSSHSRQQSRSLFCWKPAKCGVLKIHGYLCE